MLRNVMKFFYSLSGFWKVLWVLCENHRKWIEFFRQCPITFRESSKIFHTVGMSMSLVYLGSLFTVEMVTLVCRVFNSKLFCSWQVSVVSEMTAVEWESVLESEIRALSKNRLFSYITSPRPFSNTARITKTRVTLVPLVLELNSWATSRSRTVCK